MQVSQSEWTELNEVETGFPDVETGSPSETKTISRSGSLVLSNGRVSQTEDDAIYGCFLSNLRRSLHEACRDGCELLVRELLSRKCSTVESLNSLNQDGLAPVHYAAHSNQCKIIQMLLDAGADVNAEGSSATQRCTPIVLASKFDAQNACHVLVRNGADVMARTTYGQTALHYAARRGHVKVVEILLVNGMAEVNLVDNDNATALHGAVQAGKDEVVDKLLYHGGDITMKDNDGYTAFHLAARDGHSKILRKLIHTAKQKGHSPKAELDAKDNYGNTCLHSAIKGGHYEAAQICLELKVDCCVKQGDLGTPLHLASSHGQLDIVKMLVKCGANMKAQDDNGMMALHRASQAGHVPVIEYLLSEGAQLYSERKSRQNVPIPLLCAVEGGQPEAVKYLLARGTPIDLKDACWRSALHLAVTCADVKTIQVILEAGGNSLLDSRDNHGKTPLHYCAAACHLEIIELLISAGADLRARDDEEKIPLHYAAERGNTISMGALIKACPEAINDIDYKSCTALHMAACKGRSQACTLLLKHRAEVDYRDDDRLTPLCHAAMSGCPYTVEVLLDHGADIDTLDKNRKTPLILASSYGSVAVVKLLLSRGANIATISTKGCNCLDVAIHARETEVCYAIIGDERWQEVLNNSKHDGVTAMRHLIEKMPCVAKVVMDKCIVHSSYLRAYEDYSVTYDFQYICPEPDYRYDVHGVRFCGPKTILDSGQEYLLFHPLTSKLLQLKWSRIGLPFFCLGALVYAVFLGMLSHYIYCLHEMHESNITSTEPYCARSHDVCTCGIIVPQKIFLVAFAGINLLYESYQVYTERWQYISISNFLEVVTFVLTLFTLLPHNSKPSVQQWAWGLNALLFAFITILVYFQLIFQSGIYVMMLFEVLKSLLKVMLLFFVLIFAYGLIFYLLLEKEDPYGTLALSMVKVFDMMIGEVEYSQYFVESHYDSDLVRWVSRWMFLTFGAIMSIAFMNLLIGLAVGDIESVKKDAVLKRISMQVEALYVFEEKIPLMFLRRVHIDKLVVMPNKAASSFITQAVKCLGMSCSQAPQPEPQEDGNHQLSAILETLANHKSRMKELSCELKFQRTLLENIANVVGANPEKPNSTRDVLDQL